MQVNYSKYLCENNVTHFDILHFLSRSSLVYIHSIQFHYNTKNSAWHILKRNVTYEHNLFDAISTTIVNIRSL